MNQSVDMPGSTRPRYCISHRGRSGTNNSEGYYTGNIAAIRRNRVRTEAKPETPLPSDDLPAVEAVAFQKTTGIESARDVSTNTTMQRKPVKSKALLVVGGGLTAAVLAALTTLILLEIFGPLPSTKGTNSQDSAALDDSMNELDSARSTVLQPAENREVAASSEDLATLEPAQDVAEAKPVLTNVIEAQPAQADVSEPEPAQPDVNEVQPAQADVPEPELAQPDVIEAQPAQADAPEPELAQTDVIEAQPAQADVSEPEPAQPDVIEARPAQADMPEPEPAQPDVIEAQLAQADEAEELQIADEYLEEIDELRNYNMSLQERLAEARAETLDLNTELLRLELARSAQVAEAEAAVETRTVYNFTNIPAGGTLSLNRNASSSGQGTHDSGSSSNTFDERDVYEDARDQPIDGEPSGGLLQDTTNDPDGEKPMRWDNDDPVEFIDAYSPEEPSPADAE